MKFLNFNTSLIYYFPRRWFILDSFLWTLSPVSIAFYIEISSFFTLVSAEHPPIPPPSEQHKGCLGAGGVKRAGDPTGATAGSMNLVRMRMLWVAALLYETAEQHTEVNSTLSPQSPCFRVFLCYGGAGGWERHSWSSGCTGEGAMTMGSSLWYGKLCGTSTQLPRTPKNLTKQIE